MNESTEVIPEENDPSEDMIVGSIWLFLAGSAMLLYIPPLFVIGTDASLKQHSCYKLLFQQGLSDIITLSVHIFLSSSTILRISYKIPLWFSRTMGAAIEAWCWHMYTWLIHVVAFNRYIIMCAHKYEWTLFGPKATRMWQTFCWTYGLCIFIILMSPKASFLYYASSYSFYYDVKKPWFTAIKTYAWLQNTVNFAGTTIWYLLIFRHIKKIKNDISSQCDETGTNRRQMSEGEKAILKQAAIIGLYTVLYDQLWHFLPSLYYSYGFKYAFALGNYCWITTCFVNPIVYLTINKTVSKKVKKMLGLKSASGGTCSTTRVRSVKSSRRESKY